MGATSVGESVAQLARIGTSVFGIVIIIVGLTMVLKIFGSIHDILVEPEAVDDLIGRWAKAMGGGDAPIKIEGTEVNLGRFAATIFLGMGGYVLSRIALSIMQSGARIVQMTTGDKEAVKRIIQQALRK
jgi:hypothetical protein